MSTFLAYYMPHHLLPPLLYHLSYFFPLIVSTSASVPSLLILKNARHAPASQPWQLLFPLPGALSPGYLHDPLLQCCVTTEDFPDYPE